MALSTDKSHNFALIVESSLGEIASTMNKDILDPLWELNGWDPEKKPTLEPEPIRFRNPENITSAILDLARAGAVITPEDPVVDALRDVLNLPRTTKETLADQQLGGRNPLDPNADPNADPQPDSDTTEGAINNIQEDLIDS